MNYSIKKVPSTLYRPSGRLNLSIASIRLLYFYASSCSQLIRLGKLQVSPRSAVLKSMVKIKSNGGNELHILFHKTKTKICFSHILELKLCFLYKSKCSYRPEMHAIFTNMKAAILSIYLNLEISSHTV